MLLYDKIRVIFFFLFLSIILTMFVSSSDIKGNGELQSLLDMNRIEEKLLINRAISSAVTSKINLEHLKCLTTNIYYEARGEPFIGQVAVARVVMNRIKYGFASNPCKVVYQAFMIKTDEESDPKKICQFSWACDTNLTPPRNSFYLQAEDIARKVLLYDSWKDHIPSNILFFHSTSVDPDWKHKKVMTIGNHVFYSKN